MADDDKSVSPDDSSLEEVEKRGQDLSIRNNRYFHPPEGWEKEAERINAEKLKKKKHIDDKGESEQKISSEEGSKDYPKDERVSAKNLDEVVEYAKNHAGNDVLKSGDGEAKTAAESRDAAGSEAKAQKEAEEHAGSGDGDSKSTAESNENEDGPIIASGRNISLGNDPASAYAQKLGLRANILDADEEVNEISGISVVRYSDEEQIERNGAYRVTYDFTSGDTVNRLFASYDVNSAVHTDEKEQTAENGQEQQAEKENSVAENDKDETDGKTDEKSESKSDEKSVDQNDKSQDNKDLDKDKENVESNEKAEGKEEAGDGKDGKDGKDEMPELPKADILVDMEQLQEYLRSARNDKPNEFFNVDDGNKKFNFSLCGAEGVYDTKSKKFEKLSINGQPVAEEELKNYSGTQLFNMVPMGAMLGDAADKPVTSKSLQDMSSRDEAIAACKDERLQELLKEIDGSCKKMTQFSKSYAGERGKISDLDWDAKKALFPAQAWNKIANKFDLYSESKMKEMEGKGAVKRFLYNAMKPSVMAAKEKKAYPQEKMNELDAKLAKQYKSFKSQYEELQNVVNSLPAETASRYSEELGRLSEGMKCFKEWEEYRNSSAFEPEKHPSQVKNYAECMNHNCKLISKDLATCAEKLSHVHNESCHCCYDRQIQERSRQEEIDKSNVKPGYGVPAIDNFRAFAKTATNDEIAAKGSVEAVAVDKMLALNIDRDKIVDALAQGSRRFVGESNDVIGKFVDSRIENINDEKSKGSEVNYNQNSASRGETSKKTPGRGEPTNAGGNHGRGGKGSEYSGR